MCCCLLILMGSFKEMAGEGGHPEELNDHPNATTTLTHVSMFRNNNFKVLVRPTCAPHLVSVAPSTSSLISLVRCPVLPSALSLAQITKLLLSLTSVLLIHCTSSCPCNPICRRAIIDRPGRATHSSRA